MKTALYTFIILMITSISLFGQESGFNSPVSKSATLSCKVIKPLTICPQSTVDYINWPTIPVGTKYTIGTNKNEDADSKSIFTINGEPGYPIEISIDRQMILDNVEISYQLKGTPERYIGLDMVPLLDFDNGKAIVNLNTGGAFYLHIAYEWVWAKEGATPGERHFVQTITTQYNDL